MPQTSTSGYECCIKCLIISSDIILSTTRKCDWMLVYLQWVITVHKQNALKFLLRGKKGLAIWIFDLVSLQMSKLIFRKFHILSCLLSEESCLSWFIRPFNFIQTMPSFCITVPRGWCLATVAFGYFPLSLSIHMEKKIISACEMCSQKIIVLHVIIDVWNIACWCAYVSCNRPCGNQPAKLLIALWLFRA